MSNMCHEIKQQSNVEFNIHFFTIPFFFQAKLYFTGRSASVFKLGVKMISNRVEINVLFSDHGSGIPLIKRFATDDEISSLWSSSSIKRNWPDGFTSRKI